MTPVANQQSLFWGALISLALATAIDLLLGGPLLDVIGMRDIFAMHAIIVLTIAALYYVWGLENIDTGFRAAILIFGNARLKKSGQGLSEGYQWILRPFMKLRPLDTRLKKLDLNDPEGAYAMDGPRMSIEAYLSYKIYDLYRYLGVEDAPTLLQGLALQALRNKVKKLTAVENRNANKIGFSDDVARDLHQQLESKDNPMGINWGLKTGLLVVKDIWATDEELSKDWAEKAREEAQGEAEEVQTTRRLQQVKKYTDAGVSHDLAVVAAQTDVEKPGVKINTINVPGLSEAIEGIGSGIAKGVEAFLKSQGNKP